MHAERKRYTEKRIKRMKIYIKENNMQQKIYNLLHYPLLKKKRTKSFVIAITASLFCLPGVFAQQVGVKTNILYDATTTLNVGFEVGMARKWTLELPVNYNPWTFSNNRKWKHWLIQPEARYWFCEKFNGHFMGIHAHIAGYNISDLPLFGMENYRYQGTLYGAGVSYGYQWILNAHWSIEATLGVGYAYIDRSKYPCTKCSDKINDAVHHYVGPTKAGISLIYIIK